MSKKRCIKKPMGDSHARKTMAGEKDRETIQDREIEDFLVKKSTSECLSTRQNL